MEVRQRIVMSQKESRDALRVLDGLDRWDARFRGFHVERRKHERVPYRTLVAVYVPELHLEGGVFQKSFESWARNLSQGGLSFVCSERLMLKELVVALNPHSDSPSFYRAEISRSRQVQDGFWEHAVEFVQRYTESIATDTPGVARCGETSTPQEWIPTTASSY